MNALGNNSGNFINAIPIAALLPVSRRNVSGMLRTHVEAFFLLYGLFLLVAMFSDVIFIRGGIGVLQNPPFFAHFIATFLSIPFVAILVRQTYKALQFAPKSVQLEFDKVVSRTRFAKALYGAATFAGIVALAYSVAMASTFRINIYDAIDHPFPLSSIQ